MVKPQVHNVPVTVTYPDGTKDHVDVPVTVKEQPDKDKYEPKVTPVTKDFGTPTTADEVKSSDCSGLSKFKRHTSSNSR